MIWRPFQFDDMVQIFPENLQGRVVDRNFMYVLLQEDSGALIKVPNNLFLQKIIRVTPAAIPLEANERD
jgi:small-conductance mechanosensitive channel